MSQEILQILTLWSKGRLTKQQVVSRIIYEHVKGPSFALSNAAKDIVEALDFIEEETKRDADK